MASEEGGSELCETVELGVPFSAGPRTGEWLVALEVFCVGKGESAVCCSGEAGATAGVLGASTRGRTTSGRDRGRYFLLIGAAGGVGVLLVLG